MYFVFYFWFKLFELEKLVDVNKLPVLMALKDLFKPVKSSDSCWDLISPPLVPLLANELTLKLPNELSAWARLNAAAADLLGDEMVGEPKKFICCWLLGEGVAGGEVGGVWLPASEFMRKAAAALDMRPFSLNNLMQVLSFSAYGQYLMVWAWSPEAWQMGHWYKRRMGQATWLAASLSVWVV